MVLLHTRQNRCVQAFRKTYIVPKVVIPQPIKAMVQILDDLTQVILYLGVHQIVKLTTFRTSVHLLLRSRLSDGLVSLESCLEK